MIEIERQMYRFLNAKPDIFGTEGHEAHAWLAPYGTALPRSYIEELGQTFVNAGDVDFDHLFAGLRALLGRGPVVGAFPFGRTDETPRLLLEVQLLAWPPIETLPHRDLVLVVSAHMGPHGLRLVLPRAVVAGAAPVLPEYPTVTFEARPDRWGDYFTVYGSPEPTTAEPTEEAGSHD